MAGATALHLLSQPDARHGHHPVQGLQQGGGGDDGDDGDDGGGHGDDGGHHPVQGLQQGDDGGRDYEDETPLKKTNEVLHF